MVYPTSPMQRKGPDDLGQDVKGARLALWKNKFQHQVVNKTVWQRKTMTNKMHSNDSMQVGLGTVPCVETISCRALTPSHLTYLVL